VFTIVSLLSFRMFWHMNSIIAIVKIRENVCMVLENTVLKAHTCTFSHIFVTLKAWYMYTVSMLFRHSKTQWLTYWNKYTFNTIWNTKWLFSTTFKFLASWLANYLAGYLW
jgi:hypothetical protein